MQLMGAYLSAVDALWKFLDPFLVWKFSGFFRGVLAEILRKIQKNSCSAARSPPTRCAINFVSFNHSLNTQQRKIRLFYAPGDSSLFSFGGVVTRPKIQKFGDFWSFYHRWGLEMTWLFSITRWLNLGRPEKVTGQGCLQRCVRQILAQKIL